MNPRVCSPAAERNRAPLLAELQRVLPSRGNALEIASGTGQHAAHFASGLPGWRWQPTDAEPGLLASIDAWCGSLDNVEPALLLDVQASPWPGVPVPVDLLFCANLLHIAPWPVCAALMRGAARHLAPHGRLMLYGPYRVDGEPLAPGNQVFDADLKMRNPLWGLRRLGDVCAEAEAVGFTLKERVAMPANNCLLLFMRDGAAAPVAPAA